MITSNKKLLAAAAGATGGGFNINDSFSMDSLSSTGDYDNGLALSTDGGLVITKKTSGSGNPVWWTFNHGSSGAGWSYVRHLRTSSGTGYGSSREAEFTSGSLMHFKSGTGINWPSSAYTGSPIKTFAFKNTAGFFQTIKYSGDGNSSRLISHSLGCEWGWAILKQRNDSSGDHNWVLMSSALGADEGRADIMLRPNTPNSWDSYWCGDVSGTTYNANKTTAINMRNFDYGSTNLPGNASGMDYVMFVWAHNPTNGIFCGVFDTDGSGNYTHSSIGFQPRFGIFKDTDNSADYLILSTELGWGSGNDTVQDLNDDVAADTGTDYGAPTSNGFSFSGTASTRYVFMVII